MDEAPPLVKPKKKKIGLLRRKTIEIEKKIAALDAKADLFRAKLAAAQTAEQKIE